MIRPHRAFVLCLAALALVTLAPPTLSAPLVRKVFDAASSKAEKPAPAASIAEQRAGIEKALDAARKAAADERAGTYPVPAGATPSQVTDLGFLLQRLPVLLQAQLDVLGEIESARSKRAEEEEALARWKGFDEPGPYSLMQLDRLLDQLDAERTRLHAFQSVATLNQEEVARVEARLKSTQADERLALEKAADGVVAPLELARLQTRRVTEMRQLLLLQGELNAELTQASRAREQLLERQAAAMSANYRFNEQEFERVIKNLQAQQLVFDRRIEETSVARSRSLTERDQVLKALGALPTPKAVDEVRRHAELQARLDAINVTLEALRTQQSALSTLRGLAPISIEAWRQRYASLSDPDPEKRRTAEKSLVSSLARVDALKSYATDLSAVADAAVKDQQRRVDGLDEKAPGRRYALAALEATQRAADAADEVQELGQRLATAQKRWRQEFADAAEQRSASEKAAAVWAEAKDLGREVWDFELFAVEDTVDIAGKPTTVSRGVTVGKSIGALLLFILGYKIAGFFALRAQRLMVERFAVDAAQARVLRRWMMLLTGFVLAVITLNLARIPLTVFAFMGGALAIGIGFGTQTLLRNFISGIIVLFERKVRVGDIVDVDGIQGVVTAVDIRSTTVRQFDGIETMVPNSLLLEQKVTNWTGESPTMRRVVKVGVAYGSPTRQVADIMKAAADEHGLVLKEPAPYVIFEDFGDNALVFALYFWVDLAKSNGMQVQSDLRFMLERRFAGAAISIAFPQRDIHLDSARPLQVEVVGRAVPPAQAT
jgi:small-conductance mechanosensitive channel